MTKLRILWPWHKIEQGQGFFIPCLDPEPLRAEGLSEALKARVFNAHAVEGVYAGRFGLLFIKGVQMAGRHLASAGHMPFV
jgi:hypothetical protein